MILTKLGSLIWAFIVEYFANKKDNEDIDDAFNEPVEGDVASGLNDVFTR